MRKHGPAHDEAPRGGASSATLADLASAVADLAEAERRRARAVGALARVRARGDGEAAVGMPVEQHLRWRTNLRRGTVSTLAVLTDVAPDLPGLMAALERGAVTFDQAAAVAWPAARVSRAQRVALDGALDADDDWTRLSPDVLEVEVDRLLEELADPAVLADREQRRREAQYLHLQPTLDGQGLRFHGQAVGVDAALIDQTLRHASAAPTAEDTPDPDGVLVRSDAKQGRRLFDGFLRILADWGAGRTGPGVSSDEAASPVPDVTILAIVDEREDAPSTSAELLTATRGLAPRLSATEVARLRVAGARTVHVFADADGDLVAIDGRRGHLRHAPAGLSEDTTRLLCLARDATCRMPGCANPALTADLHHLRWKSWGRRPDRSDIPDDPSNRALVCRRCHHRVVHRWRWTAPVGTAGTLTWRRREPAHPPPHRTRAGPAPPTSAVTLGRLRRRLRPPPSTGPEHDDQFGRDQFGDPLPF